MEFSKPMAIYRKHFLFKIVMATVPRCLQGFGDFWIGWRTIVLHTPPKTSIFGDLKVKADLLSCSKGNCLLWRSRPNTILGRPCAFGRFQKVKVGHLTTLAPDPVSSILVSTFLEATSPPCQPCSGLLYFKILQKVNRKCA